MRKRMSLVLITCSLVSLATVQPAHGCDGSIHSDCLSKAQYETLEACNEAIARNKKDFHAWLDRAVIETREGKDDAAIADLKKASRLLKN